MTDIIIVDGNAGLAAMLATALQLEGFSAEAARTCHNALRAITLGASLPRALVVDHAELLHADFADLEQLQQLTERIPCLVMTTDWRHLPMPAFHIAGTLFKPFHLAELLAQIQLALHQTNRAA